MPSDTPFRDYREIVDYISRDLLKLGAASLAELRRMPVNEIGVLPFWYLARNCGFSNERSRTEKWVRIVKIMALLAPKGEERTDCRLHDSRRSLGDMLCTGGVLDWHSSGAFVQPFVSEFRLMRFLAQPHHLRLQTLEAFARRLANIRDADSGVNCAEIAALVLFPDNKRQLQELASAYYRRLASASRNQTEETVQ